MEPVYSLETVYCLKWLRCSESHVNSHITRALNDVRPGAACYGKCTLRRWCDDVMRCVMAEEVVKANPSYAASVSQTVEEPNSDEITTHGDE